MKSFRLRFRVSRVDTSFLVRHQKIYVLEFNTWHVARASEASGTPLEGPWCLQSPNLQRSMLIADPVYTYSKITGARKSMKIFIYRMSQAPTAHIRAIYGLHHIASTGWTQGVTNGLDNAQILVPFFTPATAACPKGSPGYRACKRHPEDVIHYDYLTR